MAYTYRFEEIGDAAIVVFSMIGSNRSMSLGNVSFSAIQKVGMRNSDEVIAHNFLL